MRTIGSPGRLLDLRSRTDLQRLSVALAYSGGPDATALAARLMQAGANVIPVYVRYRNPGGKTSKDLKAAKLSAQKLGLSTELIDCPLVKSITGDAKSARNRIMLEAISTSLGKKVHAIALGTFLETFSASDQWTAESNQDLDPEVLGCLVGPNRHRLITWDSYGIKSKADEFRGLSKKAQQALFATTSCQMWWRIECGNCYSCMERHAAFLEAFGKDPTVYRPKSNVMKQR